MGPPPDQRGRRVDWKLLFNQLFALELKKEHVLSSTPQEEAETLDRLLRAYTQYTPATFNEAIDEISSVESSDEAYEARVAFYENPVNRRLISELDFSRSIGDEVRELEPVKRFLDEIVHNKDRSTEEGECFFETPEGRNFLEAVSFDGRENDQEIAFIFIPGFAGHTIKYALFEEIVRDINTLHDRPAERPLLREDGIELEFEDHATYYARGKDRPYKFDILQPAGGELGNTTGRNVETTDLLYDWIAKLPQQYSTKKLIFLGYSKGAPIVLDLIHRHPDMAPRILGYVTFGGVVQGAHVARLALEQVGSVLRDVPLGEFVDQLRTEEPTHLGRILSPLFADIDLGWLSVPRIRAVFDALGHDITPIERQLSRILEGREIREIMDGAGDLIPLERVRWNLAHLDNETFTEPTFIFNLSALTDVKDFVRPVGLRLEEDRAGSLLTPALTAEGDLDWRQLSLDALFLYVTSIEGFKTAPGGLFDTQVDLGSTKTPLLDRRSLSATLTEAELEELWEDDAVRAAVRRNGIRTFEDFATTPRRELIASDRCDHIDAVDLGEFKGHHWTPFVQALRPPPELSREHAVWDFPRKAFMRALLQLLAFYNVVRHADTDVESEGEDAPGYTRRRMVSRPPEEGDFRDVVLLRTEGEESTQQHLFNVYNLGTRAVMYGLVVNSARTGLGTAPPLGSSLSTESLYYQALRVYSYFDWEFRRALLNEPSMWPLPPTLALIVGRFPKTFTGDFADEPIKRLNEVRKALQVIAPGMEPFELRRLGGEDYARRPGSRNLTFSPAIRENLWRGTRAKLAALARDAYGTEIVDLNAKLVAMLGAFAPICSVFTASFVRAKPERSTSHLTLYLPAFHTLHADEYDHPRSWYLEKGLRDFVLPRPVQLATAEITRIRYLHEADLSKDQAVKLEIHRDFDGRDRLTTVASFGTLFGGPPEELFAFDTSDHRDALHVVFRPGFSPVEGDKPADRAFKEAFNRVFSLFEIEARIHQLTLHYRRRSSGVFATQEEDFVLRPRFALEESRISFRVHRYVETAVERLPLTAAGFSCEESDDDSTPRYHCFRDFWTWDHLLEEFFAGRSLGSGRLRLPTYFRERLVEQLVGTATRAVVDRSIVAIEDALDQEISMVVDDSLKRYSKTRSVLVERLHDVLF